MPTISKKICLLGDFAVGKTSLIRRFVDQQFSDQYLSTVGVKISRKTIELPDSQLSDSLSLQLLIWDLEGSTKFKAIAPNYLQGSKGAVVVADVTRPETIERVSDFIQSFLWVNPTGLAIVALNKSDLLDESEGYKPNWLEKLAEKPRVIGTYFTSAKADQNVHQIFKTLAYKMAEKE